MPRNNSEDRLIKYMTFAFGTVTQLIIGLLNAWFVMLALDVANEEWPVIPAFGYWATFVLVIGISSLAGAIHGGMRVKVKED